MFWLLQKRRHTQLLTAAEFGYVGAVKMLILRKYVDVNATNKVSSAYLTFFDADNVLCESDSVSDILNLMSHTVAHHTC